MRNWTLAEAHAALPDVRRLLTMGRAALAKMKDAEAGRGKTFMQAGGNGRSVRAWMPVAFLALLFSGCSGTADAPAAVGMELPAIADVLMEGIPPGISYTSSYSHQGPLNVTFTLAGGSHDMPYEWAFDADGDLRADVVGTALPYTFSHTYARSGLHAVTYAVWSENGKAVLRRTMDLRQDAFSAFGEAKSSGLDCGSDVLGLLGGPPAGWTYNTAIDMSADNLAPRQGSQLQIQQGATWADAPMAGQVPVEASGIRLCPPQGWPVSYSYTVEFVPPVA